ncbi:hypothetical protein GJAV_G00024890 [Gymnothorax javanicus]|nr:hypothetical protein GJAV_G00024890 [Gymnothorax javanicus]
MASLATAASGDVYHKVHLVWNNELLAASDGDDFNFASGRGDRSGMANASQAKKTQFLRTAENLRRQVDKLEKEKALSNQSRNLFRDDSGTIEELESKLTQDRATEVIKLQQHLKKIRNGVNRFQRQLMDVKLTPELIEKLKEIMTEVEFSISSFKEDKRQSYEELLKSECTCSQEVSALEKKIAVWALAGTQGSKAVAAPPAHPTRVRVTQTLPPEVKELERFLLATGGRQGGWDQYDHEVFLRERAKKRGRDAPPHVPGKTSDEVVRHEEWYQELLHLEEKKKEAILRWRSQRQRRREQELRQQKEEEDSAKQEEAQSADSRRRQEAEERREVAARLEAWRAERRAQEAAEHERRVREEVLQRKKAKEEQRRQQEVKMALETQIRERKMQQELLLMEREYREQEEMEERRRAAAIGIRTFRERDLSRVETKLQEKQMKAEEEEERQKRLARMKERVEANVSRDPSRLCQPTKGWQERTKIIGPTGGGPVSQMFHRAVPSWRQGL